MPQRPPVAVLVSLMLAASARAEPLALIQEIAEGDGGLGILAEARTVAVSPDGAHVYAGSPAPGAIAVLDPDDLAILGSVVEGEGGVDGLAGVARLAFSPDGVHLYATSDEEDSVAVFVRDPATGLLTFVEVEREGAGGVSGLIGAWAVAVSPDGAHVYVTGLGRPVQASTGIGVFARDAGTGALTFVDSLGDVSPIRALAFAEDGAHLYAAAIGYLTQDTGLTLFERDAQTGALVLAWTSGAPLEGLGSEYFGELTGLYVSPDEQFLYASLEGTLLEDPGNGGIATLARTPGTGAVSFLAFDGVFQIARRATALAASDGGARLYVANPGAGTLHAFTRDPVGGGLTPFEGVAAGVEPIDVAASPLADRVYVADPGHDAVAAFAPPEEGEPVERFARRDDGGVRGLREGGRPVVSPDGHFVYVGGVDGLARFARDPATGLLVFESLDETFAERGAATLAIGALGDQAYTTVREDDVLYVHARDVATGALTLDRELRDGVDGIELEAPRTLIQTSPDGRFVYVGAAPSVAAIFERGLLTNAIVQRPSAAVGSIGGVLLLSHYGRRLFADSAAPSRVRAFQRNVGTGSLTLLGDASVVEPGGSLVLTNDDRQLYRLGTDHHVTRLRVDTPGGIPVVEDRVEFPPSFGELVLARDGRMLYYPTWRVTQGGGSEFAGYAFERDVETGSLTQVQWLGSIAERGIAVSADSRHVYGARPEGQLAVFAVPAPSAGACTAIALVALVFRARRHTRRRRR